MSAKKRQQHITKLMSAALKSIELRWAQGEPAGFVYSAIKQEGSFVSVLIGL